MFENSRGFRVQFLSILHPATIYHHPSIHITHEDTLYSCLNLVFSSIQQFTSSTIQTHALLRSKKLLKPVCCFFFCISLLHSHRILVHTILHTTYFFLKRHCLFPGRISVDSSSIHFPVFLYKRLVPILLRKSLLLYLIS